MGRNIKQSFFVNVSLRPYIRDGSTLPLYQWISKALQLEWGIHSPLVTVRLGRTYSFLVSGSLRLCSGEYYNIPSTPCSVPLAKALSSKQLRTLLQQFITLTLTEMHAPHFQKYFCHRCGSKHPCWVHKMFGKVKPLLDKLGIYVTRNDSLT